MPNIFPIYKPIGWTSFDVVAKVRKILGVKKVGHAGTLDPLAEGVLVIAVGREATKTIAEIVGKEKEYVAKIRLGLTSETDDEEGKKVHKVYKVHKVIKSDSQTKPKVKKSEIEQALKKFIGTIEQVPPQYSAIKTGGLRAYQLARKGRQAPLRPRQVFIREIELVAYRWPFLTLRVVTGPGVYIRSLARDLGEILGVGGYLAGLVRTRVGEYTLADCQQLADLK